MSNLNDSVSLTLPCGKTAVVSAFDGECQAIASNKKHLESGAWFDLILRRVTVSLNGRPSHQLGSNQLINLRSGSRVRIVLAARQLTYGDIVTLAWTCFCGRENSTEFDLSEVEDVPYPEVEEQECEVRDHVIRIAWGTGVLEDKFLRDHARGLWGAIHEPLLRITAVDGQPLGPIEMKKLGGGLLDEFMRAVRSTNPRVLLGGEKETDEMNPFGLKRGGVSSRVQVACDKCGRTGTKDIQAAPDFLHRSMLTLDG